MDPYINHLEKMSRYIDGDENEFTTIEDSEFEEALSELSEQEHE